MRMAIVVFLTCVRIIGGGAQPAPLNGDDRDVLEAVSEPIKVVDQARPFAGSNVQILKCRGRRNAWRIRFAC
jgi:hypothetical protein